MTTEYNNFRFYHCKEDWNSLKCELVENPYVLPCEQNTKLVYIYKLFPKIFDSFIIRNNYYKQKNIIISN